MSDITARVIGTSLSNGEAFEWINQPVEPQNLFATIEAAIYIVGNSTLPDEINIRIVSPHMSETPAGTAH